MHPSPSEKYSIALLGELAPSQRGRKSHQSYTIEPRIRFGMISFHNYHCIGLGAGEMNEMLRAAERHWLLFQEWYQWRAL